MYSGTTFHGKSGRMAGVHQRIDRIARRSLKKQLSSDVYFPTIREILHFEGKNGPDGIKRKSPGQDEPWHYIDPYDELDTQLLDMIDDHIYNLAQALRGRNEQRAAFEAAWLAHAVVDGLTPAHHYPLEERIIELRGGQGLETRTTKKEKLILPGETRRHQVRNNWEFWGTKGIMTTHLGFELGVMTTLAAQKFERHMPHQRQLVLLQKKSYREVYKKALEQIAGLNMYEDYMKHGWTRKAARRTREILIPRIVEMVLLAWLAGVHLAEEDA